MVLSYIRDVVIILPKYMHDIQWWFICFHMDLVARKPVFGVSDKVRFKPACSGTGIS